MSDPTAVWRRRLNAVSLANAFGYSSGVARRFVKALYNQLTNASVDAYEKWRASISQVYPVSDRELVKPGEWYGLGGGADGARLLFAVQTYYAVVLKLLTAEAVSRLSGGSSFISDLMSNINSREALMEWLSELEHGVVFQRYGVVNFPSDDLFNWYLNEFNDNVYNAVRDVVSVLNGFTIEPTPRDVFKVLYEELVPRREVRQKMGIYTTPDWLAELVLNELGLTVGNFLKMRSEGKDPLDLRILDPGVGTGTFLSLVIQRFGEYLRQVAKSEDERSRFLSEALIKITRNVVGFDIDALMVLTAKANYLIALASIGLLQRSEGNIELPIYMVNSLERHGYVQLFDYVVGNPPWLTYRDIEDVKYQEMVKKLAKDTYNLVGTDAHVIANIELATLFFIRAVDLYLRDGGLIGFVMPRTIFNADQHSNFRHGAVRGVRYGFVKVIDTGGVEPLFYVPSCVLIARKGVAMRYPVDALVLEGNLPEDRHMVLPLSEALKSLKMEARKLYLNKVGSRSFLDYNVLSIARARSDYYSEFYQGASTMPHATWLIDIVDASHPDVVIVKTAGRVMRRGKVKQVIGPLPVEREFLYGVLTSAEVLPFCHLQPNIAVLPIRMAKGGYEIITREKARQLGKLNLARWLEEVEKLWENVRGEKKVNVYEWLNYQNKLTRQDPSAKFKVVYLTSGTYLASCVLKDEERDIVRMVNNKNVIVRIRRTIIGHTLYVYQTNSEDEAYYLVAVLNSRILDELVKPLQAKGEFGERHFAKKPLEFPIPRFDPGNPLHRRLSELGREATKRACDSLPRLLAELGYGKKLEERGYLTPNEVGRLREAVRGVLGGIMREIDDLVNQLLNNPGGGGGGGRQGFILDYV